MTITRTQYLVTDHDEADKNDYSMSATIAAGQRCVVSVAWKASAPISFSVPTWNGETFTALSAKNNQGELFTQSYYLDATTSATANITATADGYSFVNSMFAVYSSSLGWAGAPTLAYSDISPLDTFAPPSTTVNLNENKFATSIFSGLGWNAGYGDTNNVWNSTSPLTAVADVNNESNRRVRRMYFGEATGSGDVVLALAPTGGEEPMWAHSVITIAESAVQLTIDSDLTPEEERTDTCTGFADGAADISFAGVSVAVTIASGSFTWTVPAMTGGVVWPRLPSTGTTITLEQDDIGANTTADITLPVDWQTLRENDELGDEEDPNPVANFAGIVTDNDQYIGYHITLTTDDTGYFPTDDGYWISRNGAVQSNEFLIDGVTPALPRTDPFLFQDDSGLLTSHTITMTAAGLIVGGGLSVAGLSVTGLSVSGLSVSGL